MTIATDVCAACGRARGSGALCTVCLQPLVGAMLGPDKRYQIDALVSRDTTACVWLGMDLIERRRCVLQTYRSTDLTERQVLASGGSRLLLLRHPRVPLPIEVFEEQAGGLFVLVLAASEAPSLRELVATHGPMPYDVTCTLGLQICEALDFLAGHDLVHEGLTPDTISVGTPLAGTLMTVTVPRMSRKHAGGAVRGAYQAPELIAGWPYGQPIAIYGLASTLLFGLTGQDPRPGPEEIGQQLQRVGAPAALVDALTSSRLIEPGGRPELDALRAVLRSSVSGGRPPRQASGQPPSQPSGQPPSQSANQPAPDPTEMRTVHAGMRTLGESEAVTLHPPMGGQAPEPRPTPVDRQAIAGRPDGMGAEGTRELPTVADWQAAGGARGAGRDDGSHLPAQGATVEQRPGMPGAAHDDLIQTAQQVEQRGDLYGALDLYRRAIELAPPGSELAQRLMERAASVEARLIAARTPGGGRALAVDSLPTPVRQQRQGGGLRWLVLLLACLVIASIIALGRSRIWPQGRDSSGPEPIPQPTPAAVLVAPPANAPPTSTAPVRPDPTGLLGAADDARKAGDFQRAMDILQGLKAMTPPPDGIDDRLYQTHVAYGQKLLERGEHDASQAQYDAALTIRPDGREAQDGMRLVQQVRNWDRMEAQWDRDPDAAVAAAEANFKIDPEWRGTRQKLYALLIGRAERQWGRGERDAARATLEQAKAIDARAGDADDRMQRWFAPPSPRPLSAPPAQAPGP